MHIIGGLRETIRVHEEPPERHTYRNIAFVMDIRTGTIQALITNGIKMFPTLCASRSQRLMILVERPLVVIIGTDD